MRLLQLYFTSYSRKRSAEKRHQVFSSSEGFSEAEIKELERICMYSPPNHLPTQPIRFEIDAYFPIKFTSFQLQSGRYGICQSVYVGKDLSGRYGNYFSHVLVLEKGVWPIPSIQFYRSSLFRSKLSMHELNVVGKPRPLPVVEVSVPEGYFSEKTIDEFLAQNDHATRLAQMINGLIEKGGKQESILIVAKQEELPKWIAAIQVNLPKSLQQAIHYSTYVHDLERERYPIMATLGEGTRYYQEDIDQGVFGYVFDFCKDRFDPPTGLYAATADQKEWNAFINECSIDNLNEDLESATLLYQFLIEKKPLESAGYERALSFARKKASSKRLKQMMDHISVDLLLYEKRNLEETKNLSLSLLHSSEQTKEEAHKKKAGSYWIESLKGLLVDTTESEFYKLIAYTDTFLVDFYSFQEWGQLLFTDEQIKATSQHLRQLKNVRKDVFYLELLFKQLAYEDNGMRMISNERLNLVQSILDRNGHEADEEKRALLWSLSIAHPALFATTVGRCDLSHWKEESLAQIRTSFRAILKEQANDSNWMKLLLTELSLISCDEEQAHRLKEELSELIFADAKTRIKWDVGSIDQQIKLYKDWLNLSNRMKRKDMLLDCLVSTYEVSQRANLNDTVGLFHTINIEVKLLKTEAPESFQQYFTWALPLLANKLGQAGGTMFNRFVRNDLGLTIDILKREKNRFEEGVDLHLLKLIIPDIVDRPELRAERLKLVAYFAENPVAFQLVYHQLSGQLDALERLRQEIEKPFSRTSLLYKKVVLDRLPAR